MKIILAMLFAVATLYVSAQENNIVKMEYFIDVDPGFGAASSINISTPGTATLQNFAIVTSGLAEGDHKLYGRFQDTHGNWSQTFRRNIEIIKSENNKVVNGEYFFKTDNGFGDCLPVVFATPAADGTFSFNIPANQIPADADTLFVRVRDDIENRWSITRIFTNLTALPLTLLNFTASKENNTAQLSWQTANEVNTSHFNIQRSTDAIHFENIGAVHSANQKEINNYSFTDDMSGIESPVLYYRLQEVDIDGKAAYSKIVTINPDKNIEAYVIYPNPTNGYFNLIATKPGNLQGATLSVIDLSGRILLHQKLIAAGLQKIPVSLLAKGVYLVKIDKVTGTVIRKLLKE